MITYSSVDIVITDNFISVWYKGKEYFKIAIKENKLLASARQYDDTEWIDTIPLDAVKLDVNITSKEQTPIMALPKYSRKPATNRQVKAQRASRSTYTSGDTTIDERVRDRILNALLDNVIKNPQPTRSERAEANRTIANRFGVEHMAVAGVASNLTRGTYGSMRTLLTNRKRERGL